MAGEFNGPGRQPAEEKQGCVIGREEHWSEIPDLLPGRWRRRVRMDGECEGVEAEGMRALRKAMKI
jgi:hypothetical protein